MPDEYNVEMGRMGQGEGDARGGWVLEFGFWNCGLRNQCSAHSPAVCLNVRLSARLHQDRNDYFDPQRSQFFTWLWLRSVHPRKTGQALPSARQT
jgi:hypothetical protein